MRSACLQEYFIWQQFMQTPECSGQNNMLSTCYMARSKRMPFSNSLWSSNNTLDASIFVLTVSKRKPSEQIYTATGSNEVLWRAPHHCRFLWTLGTWRLPGQSGELILCSCLFILMQSLQLVCAAFAHDLSFSQRSVPFFGQSKMLSSFQNLRSRCWITAHGDHWAMGAWCC